MPVADVKQIGTLALDRPGLREGLALGAVTDPLRGALDRHRPAMVREPGYGAKAGLPRVLGETSNGHVVDHSLTKRRHGASPT